MARIIHVEDDELMGEAVVATLSAAGHLVGVVRNGRLALDTIRFKRPDMVILDCTLPGMPGVEILRRLRRDPKLYLLPILMLTGLRREADFDAAMEAGANDYLTKPFDRDQLVTRVADVLRNNDLRRLAH